MDNLEFVDVGEPHVHYRQGRRWKDGVKQHTGLFDFSVPHTTSWASFSLPMPNTEPSLRTGRHAESYAASIRKIDSGHHVIKTIKAVEGFTTPAVIRRAKELGTDAIKVYFEGVTTGANKGDAVTWDGFFEMLPVWKACEEEDIVVCIHAEKPGVFSLRREAEARKAVKWLHDECPNLRICVEHVTDRRMIRLVKQLGPNVRCTITTQHLWGNLDLVIGGLLNPHAFCKPVLKEPEDQEALFDAAVSGDPKFMFGSDSAPHPLEDKVEEGCAGCFTGPYCLQMIAHLFEKEGVRDLQQVMQRFMGDFARDFYRVPARGKQVRLVRKPFTIPDILHTETGFAVKPFMAGTELNWSLDAA